MFEPSDKPRIFAVPLGVDFPRALITGLQARFAGHPPEAMARVQLIVNTRRMARRIRDLFDQGPPALLPKMRLVTELGDLAGLDDIPDAVPPLRRRLELVQLISALLEQQPDIAPRAVLFDLADSLAELMGEMHGEGVSPDAIERLDVTDLSGHWERIKTFLGIIRHYFDHETAKPDAESRQRLIVETLVRSWQVDPPSHPVIVAGSTGSRGSTQILMQAVATLPQGAVILPGFDFDAPSHVWGALDDPLLSEDHPQYRFSRFATDAGVNPAEIASWSTAAAVNPARNRVLSLALRPAPVTDQWLDDGPELGNLEAAMEGVTLLEAPSARHEALAIAMRLRLAVEERQTAALITPDRTLTRQVTAALDRWNIIPDDSAGVPLHLSPPGRFLRHVADLFRHRLTAEALLTLLKHPLTHSGGDRGLHLLLTRELELHLRRHGPPYPDADSMAAWGATRSTDMAHEWVNWVCACFTDCKAHDDTLLDSRVSEHTRLSEQIAHGCRGVGTGELWAEGPGREARSAMEELITEAGYGGPLNAADYTALFHSFLSGKEVRNPDTPHSSILIWGTLEARVQGADLLILAGLNEGSWPEAPKPDPWLNRTLRQQAGLLLPERRIGLSAHDFQQAAAAPEVWMTRSVRSDDAETVASRWLNRLQNLMAGLPDQSGPDALGAMRDRGRFWLASAAVLETPKEITPARRPAPCPPAHARPLHLSVTEIKRLVRDPYAIYARHVLRLRPLDPLMKVPDALLRGTVLHRVLEDFVRSTLENPDLCTADLLRQKTVSILAECVPWAEARATWLARLERVSDWFIEAELGRRILAHPAAFETRGVASLPEHHFTLSATADRIDIDRSGGLHIYDYKTGMPPTRDQQTYYDKQLLLEAAIAEMAGFGDIAASRVVRAVYIGLGSGGHEVDAPLDAEPPTKVWAEFGDLIGTYLDPDTGYTARRAMHAKRDRGDYDQLARFGEWDITDEPVKEKLH